jgi:hypothetical protein
MFTFAVPTSSSASRPLGAILRIVRRSGPQHPKAGARARRSTSLAFCYLPAHLAAADKAVEISSPTFFLNFVTEWRRLLRSDRTAETGTVELVLLRPAGEPFRERHAAQNCQRNSSTTLGTAGWRNIRTPPSSFRPGGRGRRRALRLAIHYSTLAGSFATDINGCAIWSSN